MHGKEYVYWAVLSLTFILMLGSVMATLSSNVRMFQPTSIDLELEKGLANLAGTPHSPIFIDGDANLSDTALIEGWPGNGTYENPFIIERLDIDLGGAPGNCINIANTQAIFTIRNCRLTGATVSQGSGVHLYNVTNAEVIDNTSVNNKYGIHIDRSTNNTVSNNNCSSNADFGMFLFNSESNMLSDNTCTENFVGIMFDSSDSNRIVNNTYHHCTTVGIYLAVSNLNNLSGNVCTDNLDGVYFDFSDSNILANNTFRNNDDGLHFDDFSDSNIITWNVFDNNANAYHFFGNVFEYNYWSDYNGVDANNDGFGDTPYFGSGFIDSYPLVYIPTLVWIQTPMDHVLDFGLLFFSYDLNVTEHAPLSWYLNHSLFNIDNNGVITSKSILPIGIYALNATVANIYGIILTAIFRVIVQDYTGPFWIIEPTDQILRYGEALDYQLPVTDPSGIDRWMLNDTSCFTLTASFYHDGSTARITNKSVLESGSYALNITVYDSHNNSLSTIFTVIVEPLEHDVTHITTTTQPTTTPSTPTASTTPEGMNPLVTLILGIGIGAAAVIVVVIVILRKRDIF